MTVYLVEKGKYPEDTYIVGIFSSRMLAESMISRLNAIESNSAYYIEFELDATSTETTEYLHNREYRNGPRIV